MITDDAQTLQIVPVAAVAAHEFIEHRFTGMPEGRVPEIMSQGDRLGEVFVPAQ